MEEMGGSLGMCESTAESRYEGAQHRNLGEGTLGKSKRKEWHSVQGSLSKINGGTRRGSSN